MSEKIRLTGVPKTMLQTVYARAKESRGRGVIRNRKAEEVVDRPDYDFSLADRDSIMHSGVITRTVLLDRLVGDWLKRNPGAAVVNIACGLDTSGCQTYLLRDCRTLPESNGVRGNDESDGGKTREGKDDCREPREIFVGREERQSA